MNHNDQHGILVSHTCICFADGRCADAIRRQIMEMITEVIMEMIMVHVGWAQSIGRYPMFDARDRCRT